MVVSTAWRNRIIGHGKEAPDEMWRPIPSVAGRYEASSHGRIRRATASRGASAGRLLTLTPHPAGYVSVTIQEDHVSVPRLAHRLVAEAFIGPVPAGQEVNHIDGIKTNNRPSNLEYVTRAQNIRHAIQTGLMQIVGEDNPSAILTAQQVAEIRRRYVPGGKWKGGPGYKALAAEYGVSWEAIRNIIKGRAWTSAGI